MTDALILAGGVAKGAFAAGVTSVLLGPEGKAGANVDVRSVVGASSGALNAAYAAAVLHAGTEEQEIARLRPLWLEESFGRVFEPSLTGVLELRGASNEDKVLDLLRANIVPRPGLRTIELRLVVANLAGTVAMVGGAPATTFESVLLFGPDTFEDAARLETMFRSVTASAAFPGAFVPVSLEIDGRTVECIDGGAVNNTPLQYALQSSAEIDRVFVVSPQPRVSASNPRALQGVALVTHLAEMLIEERLFRDLQEAYAINDSLARLETVVPDPAVRAQVVEAVGWGGRRPITIVEIRPETDLPGGMFDGFFSRDLREAYVRSGEEAARAWLVRACSLLQATRSK